MNKVAIQPRILKGFRDSLPQEALLRRRMIEGVANVCESFGYSPIETPALEYAEILLGKGSEETDRQLYRFEDNGGRDVALRFDLTVPLARFAAMNINQLGTPFRRYHIAPVWRAEKPQRGRYREFYQCDFDIIGTRSLAADAEIVGLISSILRELKISHRLRVNHRLLLNGLLEKFGATEKAGAVLRAVDKLEKLGEDTVRSELREQAGLGEEETKQLFTLISLTHSKLTNDEILKELSAILAKQEVAQEGIKALQRVLELAPSYGIAQEDLSVDPAIARGLDYYTGTVFETEFRELPQIGSICSGGRYDDLASLYSKQELPGVGASIGLDRVLGALEHLNQIKKTSSPASALICLLDQGTESELVSLASKLRAQGIAVELFLEKSKLGNQLKYADKKGIPYAIIAGTEELAAGVSSLKDLRSGEQQDRIPNDELFKSLPPVFSQ